MIWNCQTCSYFKQDAASFYDMYIYQASVGTETCDTAPSSLENICVLIKLAHYALCWNNMTEELAFWNLEINFTLHQLSSRRSEDHGVHWNFCQSNEEITQGYFNQILHSQFFVPLFQNQGHGYKSRTMILFTEWCKNLVHDSEQCSSPDSSPYVNSIEHKREF